MNNDELIKEIKAQGYWRVEIRSTEYKQKRLTTCAEMRDLLSSATVSLRGWPYPYYQAEDTAYNGQWLEGKVAWENYREYWRLYESGQWIHCSKLHGTGVAREVLFKGRRPLPPQHAGYVPVRGGILFTLTEIFHFAVGLAQAGVLDPTAFLSVQLHNTKDYMLFESFDRFFPHEYVNQWDTPIIYEQSLPASEVSANADKIALDCAIKVFSVFGWSPAEVAVRNLVEDQKKLIERRL
ncbi:MAG: hypothetical protein MUO97_00980 [Dehalococcoidia bacterium]|nr:hypothetical protein [Dehalococcoidia bacterium]